ncbi:MAG: hypothetical protein AB1393_07680 [Candidatus Edwardsbacteria bacterium]
MLIGKGGSEHRMAQRFIRDYYIRQGKLAVIEAYIGNKNIDVVVQDMKTKKTTSIEYQKTPKHVIKNVLLDLAFSDEIIIVSSNLKVLQQIKRKIDKSIKSDEHKQKVKFQLLKEFIPQKNNIIIGNNTE